MRTTPLLVLAACASSPPPLKSMSDEWPAQCRDYDDVTSAWTRKSVLRGQYQEVLELAATFKAPEWRCAHAERDADRRSLVGDARVAAVAQAKADMAGAFEVEVMLTTWDRRENDLDRGKKSVWHIALVDEHGKEIEPVEIVKDRRPAFTLRAEFPAFGDFAVAYVARFPRDSAVLGPDVHAVKLRLSGERGGVEVEWRR
jgi:hypothetical protein